MSYTKCLNLRKKLLDFPNYLTLIADLKWTFLTYHQPWSCGYYDSFQNSASNMPWFLFDFLRQATKLILSAAWKSTDQLLGKKKTTKQKNLHISPTSEPIPSPLTHKLRWLVAPLTAKIQWSKLRPSLRVTELCKRDDLPAAARSRVRRCVNLRPHFFHQEKL